MDASIKTIDNFISRFPENVQTILQELKQTIHQAAPDAKEKISYGIPTFTLNGKNLVHFSAYEKHIGFYPGTAPITELKEQLNDYEVSKGTIRFPIDKPVPLSLVRDMTLIAVKHSLSRQKK